MNKKIKICTAAPWAPFFRGDGRFSKLKQIEDDCFFELGYSLKECPNRLVCVGGDCLGRPLPMFSETFKEVLPEIERLFDRKGNLIFIDTNCYVCSEVKDCKQVCNQLNDYLSRDKKPEIDLSYTEELDNLNIEVTVESLVAKKMNISKLPWECITSKQKKAVELYFFQGHDFRQVATTLKFYDEAHAKKVIYTALTKLAKYAAIQTAVLNNIKTLSTADLDILHDHYFKCKSIAEIAIDRKVGTTLIYIRTKNFIKDNKITWHKFITNVGKKVVYNIPEVLK